MATPANRIQAQVTGATAASLLDAIYKGIDARSIPTWSYDKDKDFTHDVDQWRNQAWLKPSAAGNSLELKLIPPTSGLKQDVRGVYLGRFSEMLINHFEKYIAQITIF